MIQVKQVLCNPYLLRLIGREINRLSKIQAREIINDRLSNRQDSSLQQQHHNRLERDQLRNAEPRSFHAGDLVHPDLLIKKYHQANNVEWMFRNGYNYLLRDRLRMYIQEGWDREYYRLDVSGKWCRYVTPTNLDILSDDVLKRLLHYATLKLSDGDDLKEMMIDITRSGNIRLFKIALANIPQKKKILRDLLKYCSEAGSVEMFEEVMKLTKDPMTQVELFPCVYHSLYNHKTDMTYYLIEKYGVPDNPSHVSLFSPYHDGISYLLQCNDPELYKILSLDDFYSELSSRPYIDEYLVSLAPSIANASKQQLDLLKLIYDKRLKNSGSFNRQLITPIPNDILGGVKYENADSLMALELLLLCVGRTPPFHVYRELYKAFGSVLKQCPSVDVLRVLYNKISNHIQNGEEMLFGSVCLYSSLSTVNLVHKWFSIDGVEVAQPPITHKVEIFEFLKEKFEFSADYLLDTIGKAVKSNNYQLATHIIYNYFNVLQPLPKFMVLKFFKSCNIDLVSYMLEAYHTQVETLVFEEHQLAKLFKQSKVIHFFVKHFKKLIQWLDMRRTFGHRVDDIISMAIYYNRLDIVQFFQPRYIFGNIGNYLSASEEMLKLVVPKLRTDQILDDESWVNIGRLGNIKLADRMISLFPADTQPIRPKLFKIVDGAYEAGQSELLDHIRDVYNIVNHYNEKNIKTLLTNNQIHLSQPRNDTSLIEIYRSHHKKLTKTFGNNVWIDNK